MTELTPKTLERINEIFRNYFVDADNNHSTDGHPITLSVTAALQSVPMVTANVTKHLRSFSQGQKVHIYNVYWGMNERAMILGRHRRKNDWIFGIVSIKSLENFRPEYVYHPKVLEKLRLAQKDIHYGIFSRFFNLPHELDARDYRHFLLTGRVPPQVKRSEADNTHPASVHRTALARLWDWLQSK